MKMLAQADLNIAMMDNQSQLNIDGQPMEFKAEATAAVRRAPAPAATYEIKGPSGM